MVLLPVDASHQCITHARRKPADADADDADVASPPAHALWVAGNALRLKETLEVCDIVSYEVCRPVHTSNPPPLLFPLTRPVDSLATVCSSLPLCPQTIENATENRILGQIPAALNITALGDVPEFQSPESEMDQWWATCDREPPGEKYPHGKEIWPQTNCSWENRMLRRVGDPHPLFGQGPGKDCWRFTGLSYGRFR